MRQLFFDSGKTRIFLKVDSEQFFIFQKVIFYCFFKNSFESKNLAARKKIVKQKNQETSRRQQNQSLK